MSRRNRVCRWTLVAFAVLALLDGIVLALRLGAVLERIDWFSYDPTGGKLLAAALLALGTAALLAAADPHRNRAVVASLIVFTATGVVMVLYRLLAEAELTPDIAWAVAALLAAFLVVFCAAFPRRDD